MPFQSAYEPLDRSHPTTLFLPLFLLLFRTIILPLFLLLFLPSFFFCQNDYLYLKESYTSSVVLVGSPQRFLYTPKVRPAHYHSGSDTTRLVFRYTVQRGDNCRYIVVIIVVIIIVVASFSLILRTQAISIINTRLTHPLTPSLTPPLTPLFSLPPPSPTLPPLLSHLQPPPLSLPHSTLALLPTNVTDVPSHTHLTPSPPPQPPSHPPHIHPHTPPLTPSHPPPSHSTLALLPTNVTDVPYGIKESLTLSNFFGTGTMKRTAQIPTLVASRHLPYYLDNTGISIDSTVPR